MVGVGLRVAVLAGGRVEVLTGVNVGIVVALGACVAGTACVALGAGVALRRVVTLVLVWCGLGVGVRDGRRPWVAVAAGLAGAG